MQLTARTQKKQWTVIPADNRAGELAGCLKISPLTAQVLINRGIIDSKSAAAFLRPKLSELIRPELMPGVKEAVSRIKQAIEEKQKITIYGDYDVDGITAVVIIRQLLMLLGANVDYYIPHRVEEGYGLSREAIESLAESGTELLITVDCGISAVAEAALAGKLGMQLIITDHHPPEENLPEAVAVVHPMLDSAYENQNCCGAMVVFKLAWALANEFNNGAKLDGYLREFMLKAASLAAMGSVADIVDLRGENRILTSFGLRMLPDCGLPGIEALIETAGLTGKSLDSFHIGFRLAPMLNAAGRMGHARLAVELLTSDSNVRSLQIAEYLKDQNNQRRSCEQKIFKQACEMITTGKLNHPDCKAIVLADENWHTGVIGIVASRIAEKYHRPAIMLNAAGQIAQGSGRSIEGFDLLKALKACSEHLNTFGGHKMAAGLTIRAEKIPHFIAEFEKYAAQNVTADDIITSFNIDATAQLSQLNMQTAAELEMLGPFGQGNPRPVFATMGVQLASVPRRVGAKGSHLQLAVTDNTNAVRCVGFGMGRLEKKLLENEFFNIAYQPEINSYNGSRSVQLVLLDVQFE